MGWRLEGLGWPVATGYGLTETAPLLTINQPGNLRFETAGHPVSEVELRIDKEAAPERRARRPRRRRDFGARAGVFSGYPNLPDKTAEAFTDDGWFRTGDLGFLDDRGDLHLAGRRSTVIVTESGEKVQPDAVEDAYQQHPAIGEIAVLGRNGRLVGLIVPKADTGDGADVEGAVRRAVEEISLGLPSHQRLAEFALTREAIPRTRLGKPQRHLLAWSRCTSIVRRMFSMRSAVRPACRAPKSTAATAAAAASHPRSASTLRSSQPWRSSHISAGLCAGHRCGPQHDADADQRDGEESPLGARGTDADERLVRLADRLVDGADRAPIVPAAANCPPSTVRVSCSDRSGGTTPARTSAASICAV